MDEELRDKIVETHTHVVTLIKNDSEIFKRLIETEKTQATHTEKLKTHSKFIFGSFGFSALSGFLTNVFLPGK